jgi:hypothetical protein
MGIIPNFIIPEAERSGTTAISSYLDQHPEIFICKMKEPNFFSKNYHMGLEWYESIFKDTREFSRFDLLRYLTKKELELKKLLEIPAQPIYPILKFQNEYINSTPK